MSKIKCICGEIIEMISVPNPNGFLSVPELSLDQIETDSEAESSVVSVFDAINDRGIQGYRCPNCQRLILFESGRGGEASFYARETISSD